MTEQVLASSPGMRKKRVRSESERDSELPFGGPCVNCFVRVGSHQPGVITAKGFNGLTHESCIRTSAMPFLVKQALALLEECDGLAFSKYGQTLGQAATFRANVSREKLRRMSREQFAALLSTTLGRLHAICANGLGGKREKIFALVTLARGRLFCEVSLTRLRTTDGQ